jgi:hypothetical protein
MDRSQIAVAPGRIAGESEQGIVRQARQGAR